MLSEDVYKDPNYSLAMKWIDKVSSKTNTSLGSVQLGMYYARFYHTQIVEMLKPEHVNIELLNQLKLKVKTDHEKIIEDCSRRIHPHRDDVQDNKIMISVILDFITSLHDV